MSRAGSARAELEAVFRAALAAVEGGACVRRVVRCSDGELRIGDRLQPPGARLRLLAAGKAAAPMARAFEQIAGPRLVEGLVVTKDGHGLPLERCRLREAGHPVPDARSEQAGREALGLAERAGPDEVLVVLLSGGASALLACPLDGLRLADLRVTTSLLLGAGAAIHELNTVRKHLGDVVGGRLAQQARGARIELLVLSDVPGDRLDVAGSGPCMPDPTTFAEAWAVVEGRGVAGQLPPAVRSHLEAGLRGERAESPKPGHPAFGRVTATILASNRTALEAARRHALGRGWRACLVTGDLAGEARVAGRRLAALGRSLRERRPVLLLAGGETTVRLRGAGRGGRSQELALAAAIELAQSPGVALLAAGTDGSDGPTDAAGAFADGASVARGQARGVDARSALARNDSHAFFAAEGGLLRTGPTGTNVMDLVLLLVAPE